MFKENGMDAVILNTLIDSHFISFLESRNTDVKFLRIDADITSTLKEETNGENEKEIKKLNEKIEKLFKDTIGKKDLKVQVEKLKSESTPAVILLSEQSRRMQEMRRMYGGEDMIRMFPNEETLVVNSNNKLVKALVESIGNKEKDAEREILVKQIYDIARLNHRPLEPEAMTAFVQRSLEIMEKLI